MRTYSDFITIDGQRYNIRTRLIGMRRSADFLDKYANRVESGVLKRELIGVFFNFNGIQFEKQDDVNYNEYNRLYDKLSEPTEFHNVKVGNFQFRAYFAGINDEIYKYKDGNPYFRNLTVNFLAESPART